MKKYKANKNYWNNAMDGFSGIGEENHIKLSNGKAVELDILIAKPFIDNKMLEEVKEKGDK
jgi:hypothetical protein|tara:strand:- start:347 stop:529 length:183 start_codon:yes stop_codon:yes gene_type:complete